MRSVLLILALSLIWGCADDKTTTTVTDNIAPYVIATHPADGDSNVNLHSPITCTFSEAVIPSTINDSSFVVTWITTFPGVITYADRTATFSHAAPMRHNVVYQATIKKTVKDQAGNAMGKDYVWNFMTTGGPSVIETAPLDGDTGVALNAVITAAFSEPMNPSTLDTSTFILSDGVTGTVSCDGAGAIFHPDLFLTHNHTYTATITGSVTDTAGNNMANNYVWSFTTTGSPLIVATYPPDGAVSIPHDTVVSVTFSIDMVPETFTAETFFLSDGATGTVTYENRKAVFIPDDSLIPDHLYTATLTTDICDIYGHTMSADYSWSFTTQGDIMPLAVGNWWAYRIRTWNESGFPTGEYIDSIIITGDTLIESEPWYQDQDGNLYTCRSDGLWMVSLQGQPRLVAKYPSEIGDSYVNTPLKGIPAHGTFNVVSTDRSVVVEAGTFTCYRYFAEPFGSPYMYYLDYSPDIGLVLFEEIYRHYSDVLIRQYALVDYYVQ